MTADAAKAAYWYRWRTKLRFRLLVLCVGIVPAAFALAVFSSLLPRNHTAAAVIAAVVEMLSPYLLASVIGLLSQRGPRLLMIDRDRITTQVATGNWDASWREVQEIAESSNFIFMLGRGINSISIPVNAFADDAERDEFLRRARAYLAASQEN